MGVVVSETLILERSARLITRSFLVHALLYFLLKLGTRELRAVPVNHLGAKPRLPCPYCVSAARLSPDDQSLLPSRGGDSRPSLPVSQHEEPKVTGRLGVWWNPTHQWNCFLLWLLGFLNPQFRGGT